MRDLMRSAWSDPKRPRLRSGHLDAATRPTLGPAGPTPGHPSNGPAAPPIRLFAGGPGPARPGPSHPGPDTEASDPARRALFESVPGMWPGPAQLTRRQVTDQVTD